MILIIGLGNFENKYKNNRHNVGFHFIDYIADKYNFIEDKKLENKLNSFVFSGKNEQLLNSLQENFNKAQNLKNKNDKIQFKFPQDDNFLLLKPKTFMNLSGKVISKYLSLFEKPNLIIVVYDDIELSLGQVKFAINSAGSGGHNGIRSILSCVGRDFFRIKIGIENENITKDDLANFVLSDFENEEKKILQNLFLNF